MAGYTDSMVAGAHEYLFLPPDRSGRGGLARYGGSPPSNAYEVSAEELRDSPPDVVLLQRLEEIEFCGEQLGRRPGSDLPAIFLEHNTPKTDVPSTRHPLADEPRIPVVHVTHFNELFWDCGRTHTRVIEHGVADPGLRYTGRLPRLAFVVNEPVRRWRVTGTDLLPHFADFDVDAFGIDAEKLPAALDPSHQRVCFAGNLHPNALYDALAERRVYLHLNRWTSLGLSLIQAMLLGTAGRRPRYHRIVASCAQSGGCTFRRHQRTRRCRSSPARRSPRGAAARADRTPRRTRPLRIAALSARLGFSLQGGGRRHAMIAGAAGG